MEFAAESHPTMKELIAAESTFTWIHSYCHGWAPTRCKYRRTELQGPRWGTHQHNVDASPGYVCRADFSRSWCCVSLNTVVGVDVAHNITSIFRWELMLHSTYIACRYILVEVFHLCVLISKRNWTVWMHRSRHYRLRVHLAARNILDSQYSH